MIGEQTPLVPSQKQMVDEECTCDALIDAWVQASMLRSMSRNGTLSFSIKFSHFANYCANNLILIWWKLGEGLGPFGMLDLD